MTPPAVSEHIRVVVQAAVDSYEKLFILRALVEADCALGAAALAERIARDHALVHEALRELARDGLVEAVGQGSYSYEPEDAALDLAVRGLIALLQHDPLELAQLMDRAAMDRARVAIDERLASGYLGSRRIRERDG